VAGVIAGRRNGIGCSLFDASIRWRAQTRIDSARRLTLGSQKPIRQARIEATHGSKVTAGAFGAVVGYLLAITGGAASEHVTPDQVAV
jgi:hypothetical protein